MLPASMHPVASTGPERAADAQLAVDPGARVEDGGEHDGERSGDGPGVALGRSPGDEGDADEAEADSRHPRGADPLVREEPEPDQEREDRHRRLRDRRAARSRCTSPPTR